MRRRPPLRARPPNICAPRPRHCAATPKRGKPRSPTTAPNTICSKACTRTWMPNRSATSLKCSPKRAANWRTPRLGWMRREDGPAPGHRQPLPRRWNACARSRTSWRRRHKHGRNAWASITRTRWGCAAKPTPRDKACPPKSNGLWPRSGPNGGRRRTAWRHWKPICGRRRRRPTSRPRRRFT